MLNRLIALLIVLTIAAFTAGCASPFQAEYYHTEEYNEGEGIFTSGDNEINNYSMLRATILKLVSDVKSGGKLRISNYQGNISDDLAAVCFEIKSETPIGTFAVDTLSYEISQIISYYTVDVFITYSRTEEEIKSVVYVSGLKEFKDYLLQGIGEGRTRMTLRIYSSMMDETSVSEMLHETYYSDPSIAAVYPEIKISSYPNSGPSRIYDIELDYGAAEGKLDTMNIQLSQAIDSVCSNITDTDPVTAAYEAAKYLSNNFIVIPEKCIYPGTIYGALQEHCDDSSGLAFAYKAICDRLGVGCSVVEGSYGTMSASSRHLWNIITIDEENYHVDVSNFASSGASNSFLLNDAQMWGTYFWDIEAYPECSGSLSYRSVEESAAAEEPKPEQETPIQPTVPHEETSPTSSENTKEHA